ncbi:GIY-YIG nuclease family protein [Candidatus Gottesmanbacteria bacterium]|nr:GIY-YIG nuclease family protein [Candidatus Gottesmanbacteria bacterium]
MKILWYLYILRCSDNSLYTGITNDFGKRIGMHRLGKGSKYVRSRLPVKLVYKEQHQDEKSARKREYDIKRMTRKQKEKLILGL